MIYNKLEDIENLKHSLYKNNEDGSMNIESITMIHLPNLNNIQELFKYIYDNNIKGDLLEAGVWKGGATIFMTALNKYYNTNKKIYACDSYEGLPKKSNYIEDNIVNGSDWQTYAVSLDEVKDNFKKYNLLDDNVIFVKGFFEESLKNINIEDISILRLDGDMYTSTISCLDELYDKVVKGGVIIIDDYGWEIAGAGKATDDFRKKRNINTKMIFSYGSCWFWIKE
jgi:hypothetical protein